MLAYLSCPARVLQLANRMLLAGVLLLLSGLLGAYGLEAQLSMGSLVTAHSLTIIGPGLLKLGYVLRLAAQQHLRKQQEPCCAVA
ncbi:MAG: transmembrane sensor/regulator PpyR [Gammaproteobacteria bacterium]|uniref:transmembrane sensor/regulator PpyR n=1 Tax=Pseudomonas sp. FEMGT703P TaxID=2080764 RepID=UPI000CC45282|nr:transmembrane sensor/regulator PpyR [Pseudomonas sp. FEMGT703P]PJE40999.1 MAG: transmembrane sensor/regulator PpyR [Pseudomonas sp.] [Pseudomonas sp. FEMGT703P]